MNQRRQAERERYRALVEAARVYLFAADALETDAEAELVEQIANLDGARSALRAALEALDA